MTIYGTSGDDLLIGGEGHDSISGYGGSDRIEGRGGNDYLYGHEGSDWIYGGSGDDQIQGGYDSDHIFGEGGNDTIYGQEGDDIISGGDGNDTLWAGAGFDQLSGGAGADVFGFTSVSMQPDSLSTIQDFESGLDTLDLTRIDADESTAPGTIRGNNTPGNEAFTVVDSTDGVTPGHLVITTGFDESGQPITIVMGYTNTDPGADIVIHLNGTNGGLPLITASDILL